MPEFLLEVGCEEIPAGWLPGLTEQMAQRFTELAEKDHLEPKQVRAASGSRRLLIRADVLARQADRDTAVWGPSVKVARDASGAWSSAAQGFARKNGVAVEALQQGPKDPAKPNEIHLLFVKKTVGQPAADVLAIAIPTLLRSLSLPKRMSWDAWLDDGKGAFPFARPIRWVVALLDGAVVPFRIHALDGGARGALVLESADVTYGHRFLPHGHGGEPIHVSSYEDLRLRLREHFVLVETGERESRIHDELTEGAGPGRLEDHGLLAEWRELVEYPTVLFGRIPDEFQTLPHEVLETVLVHHQKYIPLRAEGAVTRFAAVTNTDGASGEDIVRGMERVVVARLRDAAFFFGEDMKRPLADRVDDLAGVTFHQGLGTYQEKAERMAALVDLMGAELGVLTKPEHEAARQAALLAKADLTSLMVREFPELQGVMGGIYLKLQGAWPNVAEAVRWHYHPLSIEPESLPFGVLEGGDAAVFGAVSVADKLDTLAGHFAIGADPTGSSDPFGLRRAAHGVLRVLLDFWRADAAETRPNLSALIRAAVAGYGAVAHDPKSVVSALELFFLDRLVYVLESRHYPSDEVRAVVFSDEGDSPSPWQGEGSILALRDVHDCLIRVGALHSVRAAARDDFENLAIAFKRARNILTKDISASEIKPELFEHDAERRLHDALQRLSLSNGDYEARLRSLATLRQPVDQFFDDVLVMAENESIRANRLALLDRTLALFYRIADISKLGGQS